MANITEEKMNEKRIQKLLKLEVVNEGQKMILPEGVSDREAIEVLKRKIEYGETQVSINATIDGFMLDAAYAFSEVLNNVFGYVRGVPTPGFFGDDPPSMISVQISRTESVQVPWGRFKLPAIKGYLQTGTTQKSRNSPYQFQITGIVTRKDEAKVSNLVDMTRAYLKAHSLYKGKAVSIRFKDDDGDTLPMPSPEFIDLSGVVPEELVFSSSVQVDIETNIFTILEHAETARAAQIPLKRGVLLTGRYGVGKSLTANVTALKAIQNDWTFIMCQRADELSDILAFARDYGPAVVFCEDIDKVLSGERNLTMDQLLNIVDGVGSKGMELMVIFTTNEVERINQAMLRNGRIDAIIEVTPPDADAVVKLVRLYGRGLIPESEDISEVGRQFAGNIAATIREMVERAKLCAINMGDINSRGLPIVRCEALIRSSNQMVLQQKLLEQKAPDQRSIYEKGMGLVADAIRTHPPHEGNGVKAIAGAVSAGSCGDGVLR